MKKVFGYKIGISIYSCTLCTEFAQNRTEIDKNFQYAFLTKIQNRIDKKCEKEILLPHTFFMVVKILGW